jgi:hypothetical protein
MEANSASPLWHAALIFFGCAFLIFEVWRGWRAGFVRAAVNLGAVVVSGTFGVLAGKFAGSAAGGLDSPPGLIAALGFGGLVALILFVAIWLIGALLFKRTGQQGSGVLRFFWGGGGALVGLCIGLILLWGGITLIRALGSLAEGTTHPTASSSAPHAPRAPRVASGLVTLKESLELGPTGDFFQKVDLVAPETYELIVQVTRISSDPDAMVRFLEYPGIQSIVESPVMVDLMANPGVITAAEKRDYAALLTNPALHKAVMDPGLARQIKAIDLKEALRHALEPPASE